MLNSGIRVTFQLLARTPNQAAVDLLLVGLDCAQQTTRDHAMEALLSRREQSAQQEVFRRLPTIDEHTREILQRWPDWLARLAGAALGSRDAKMHQAACEAILSFDLYEAMPALVVALCNRDNANLELTAQTILRLTEQFYAELGKPEAERSRENFDTLRPWLTSGLEDAVRKHGVHQRSEPLEAFLLVAKRKNEILRGVLEQAQSQVCRTVAGVMKTSTRGGVVRLLLTFLQDEDPPVVVDEVLSSRCDAKFLEHLLEAIGSDYSPAMAAALGRIESLPWAVPENELLHMLDGPKQAAAVRLFVASAIPRTDVLACLQYLLLQGQPEARRAAAEAMREFRSPEADQLVLTALDDEDPQVQAHLIGQLRSRNVADAMSRLVRLADSRSPIVREALRQALPEFNIREFLVHFDTMPVGSIRLMGPLIRKLDADAPARLTEEMGCASPIRRRRAASASRAMGLATSVEEALIGLLDDSEQIVRLAAARALGGVPTPRAHEALEYALADRNVSVREAAHASLLAIAEATAADYESETVPVEHPEAM